MHALIVEDEAVIAMIIEEILRDCGFTSFDIAATCDEAIAAAGRKCPDLISADAELTPGSGIDAVSAICCGLTIPVIFITGSPVDVRRSFPRHPLVLKPFTPRDVKRAVELALKPAPDGAEKRADLASITKRVVEFVTKGRPRPFCDDCIASALAFSHPRESASVTEGLKSTGDFDRGRDVCSECQEPKMVIRRL
jgi:DNA-binding response OmpR family regulator